MTRPTIGNLNERPIRKTFLREWRKHRKLTQEAAGDLIGVDRTTLGKIERAVIQYNQRLLDAAAEVYDCEVWDLLHVNPLIPRDRGIVELFRAASPEAQNIAIKILKTG